MKALTLAAFGLLLATPVIADEDVFSFELEYSVWSDYIFRGVNNSEYLGESRERPDHQLSFQINADTGDFGTVYFNTWLNWFPYNVNGEDGQDLTEVDYTIGWLYEIKPIHTEVALQYVFFVYPNNKPVNSQEINLTLTHNDAWAWKWLWPENEDPVLTPWVMVAYDLEYARHKVWWEAGLRHDFTVTDDFTLSPLITFASDGNGYLAAMNGIEEDTRGLAYVQFGLEAEYDLTDLLQTGDWADISVGGWLYYNEAVGDAARTGVVDEEFFGGVGVKLSF